MSKKEKKKSGGKVVVAAGLVAVIAWLLTQLPGLGLGLGNGDGNGEPAGGTVEASSQSQDTVDEQTTESSSEETTEESAEETSPLLILIKVEGDVIYAGDNEFTDAESLKEYILSEYVNGAEIWLEDHQAVKAAYDIAKGVLDELGYGYLEKMN